MRKLESCAITNGTWVGTCGERCCWKSVFQRGEKDAFKSPGAHRPALSCFLFVCFWSCLSPFNQDSLTETITWFPFVLAQCHLMILDAIPQKSMAFRMADSTPPSLCSGEKQLSWLFSSKGTATWAQCFCSSAFLLKLRSHVAPDCLLNPFPACFLEPVTLVKMLPANGAHHLKPFSFLNTRKDMNAGMSETHHCILCVAFKPAIRQSYVIYLTCKLLIPQRPITHKKSYAAKSGITCASHGGSLACGLRFLLGVF